MSFQNYFEQQNMINKTQNWNSLDIARGLESFFHLVEQLPPLTPHCKAQNVLNHGRSLSSSFMNQNHYSLELKVFVVEIQVLVGCFKQFTIQV